MNQIRHRRLYAFYRSKVLNALMTIIIASLLMMAWLQSAMVPVLLMSLSLACFIGYSLWLWIKKPESITINTTLSFCSSFLTYYFLIVIGMKATGQWWYITPIALAAALLIFSLTGRRDEQFRI